MGTSVSLSAKERERLKAQGSRILKRDLPLHLLVNRNGESGKVQKQLGIDNLAYNVLVGPKGGYVQNQSEIGNGMPEQIPSVDYTSEQNQDQSSFSEDFEEKEDQSSERQEQSYSESLKMYSKQSPSPWPTVENQQKVEYQQNKINQSPMFIHVNPPRISQKSINSLGQNKTSSSGQKSAAERFSSSSSNHALSDIIMKRTQNYITNIYDTVYQQKSLSRDHVKGFLLEEQLTAKFIQNQQASQVKAKGDSFMEVLNVSDILQQKNNMSTNVSKTSIISNQQNSQKIADSFLTPNNNNNKQTALTLQLNSNIKSSIKEQSLAQPFANLTNYQKYQNKQSSEMGHSGSKSKSSNISTHRPKNLLYF